MASRFTASAAMEANHNTSFAVQY